MGKSMVIGKTRTNQPVELDPLVLEMLKTIANYQIEHGSDLDAVFKTLSLSGNASVGGALSVTGNGTIGGNLAVTGDILGDDITGNSIVENMSGYSFTKATDENVTYEYVYVGAVKNGNKLSIVVAVNITKGAGADAQISLGNIICPQAIMDKLYPTNVGAYPFLDNDKLTIFSAFNSAVDVLAYIEKGTYPDKLVIRLGDTSNMVQDTKYFVRYEATFLLSDDLIPEE